MKAIVTVIGKDQVGIIAGVCTKLAEYNVNVLDISQTVMQEYFTMMMVVDTAACNQPFDALASALADYGQNHSLSVRIQRENIFDAMHRI